VAVCARVVRAYVLINTPSYRTKLVLICVVHMGFVCGVQKGNLNGCVCVDPANDVW
jgi:hypothetical protein